MNDSLHVMYTGSAVSPLNSHHFFFLMIGRAFKIPVQQHPASFIVCSMVVWESKSTANRLRYAPSVNIPDRIWGHSPSDSRPVLHPESVWVIRGPEVMSTIVSLVYLAISFPCRCAGCSSFAIISLLT